MGQTLEQSAVTPRLDDGDKSTVQFPDGLDVAVILPCYNEAATIARVVEEFRTYLPGARIYVFDNNSADNSVALAREAGAIVRTESRQGKGHVVRRMFADVDADVYVMCDSDNTYDVSAAPELIAKLADGGLDLVVGAREEVGTAAYPPAHRFGNWMLTTLVKFIFGDGFDDMLSGYRVMSRRFVKSFPQMSRGFEIETELTVHALQLEMPALEVKTDYRERPLGSDSKLKTIPDGIRILTTIMVLLRQERPLYMFGLAFVSLVILSVLVGTPVVLEFFRSGTVPQLPSAVLATGLMILGFLSLFCGLILDTVTRGRNEAKRLRYLDLSGIETASKQHERGRML